MNVTVGDRSFLVHIPSSYNANTPHAMVVSYHGFKDNDVKQEAITGFSEKGLTLNGKVCLFAITGKNLRTESGKGDYCRLS